MEVTLLYCNQTSSIMRTMILVRLKFYDQCKGFKGNKIFSCLHTNICYIRRNFENLQNIINNLDHSFSIISALEVWMPDSKSKPFNPEILEGYQKYEIKGKSLKSCSGFYVRENIKFTKHPQNSLNLSLCFENNKFQCFWIRKITHMWRRWRRTSEILFGIYW